MEFQNFFFFFKGKVEFYVSGSKRGLGLRPVGGWLSILNKEALRGQKFTEEQPSTRTCICWMERRVWFEEFLEGDAGRVWNKSSWYLFCYCSVN